MIKLKVSDLIKKLQVYNQNADITLTTSEDITISYICKDPKGNTLTPQTTNQLFIEGIDECPTCVHNYMNEELDQQWCSFYDKACEDVDGCFEYEEFME